MTTFPVTPTRAAGLVYYPGRTGHPPSQGLRLAFALLRSARQFSVILPDALRCVPSKSLPSSQRGHVELKVIPSEGGRSFPFQGGGRGVLIGYPTLGVREPKASRAYPSLQRSNLGEGI